MSIRILYIMDPMERIQVDADSTFVMQLEGQKRGHEQFHAHPRDLAVMHGKPHVKARALRVQAQQGEHFELGKEMWTPLTDCPLAWMPNPCPEPSPQRKPHALSWQGSHNKRDGSTCRLKGI